MHHPVAKLPPISTDLLFLCLVPNSLVLLSFEHLDTKRRVHEEAIIRNTLKWYKNVVNINPCLFNFAIYAFEKLKALEFKFDGNEYAEFEHSYRFEEEAGHSHFVTGDISCHAGSIDEVLAVAFADVT